MSVKPKETESAKQAREEQEKMDGEDAKNTGTGTAARDGVPVSSLDDKRRGRTGAQLGTDGSETEPGQSEENDGQMAWDVDPTGKKMSLGSLIPKNVPVEFKTKVDGTSRALRGGINDPSVEQIAVSSLYTSKFEIAYTRDEAGVITKTIVTEHKAPRAINPAKSEAGQMMLGISQAEAV